MNDLLLILNPRRIPECHDAFKELQIDKCWLQFYSEYGLQQAMHKAIKKTHYDNYIVISDDCVVSQVALDAVQRTREEVVTGYCNLAQKNPLVNLTKTPIRGWEPSVNGYDFITQTEVTSGPDTFRTFFSGMCLTKMSKEMWERFPFKCFGGEPGYGSDFHLCKRLQSANVRITAHKDAWVDHLKETWNQPDQDSTKRLLIGEEPSRTLWDL